MTCTSQSELLTLARHVHNERLAPSSNTKSDILIYQYICTFPTCFLFLSISFARIESSSLISFNRWENRSLFSAIISWTLRVVCHAATYDLLFHEKNFGNFTDAMILPRFSISNSICIRRRAGKLLQSLPVVLLNPCALFEKCRSFLLQVRNETRCTVSITRSA